LIQFSVLTDTIHGEAPSTYGQYYAGMLRVWQQRGLRHESRRQGAWSAASRGAGRSGDPHSSDQHFSASDELLMPCWIGPSIAIRRFRASARVSGSVTIAP